jgi:benzodiazapine receptor
MSGMKQIIGLVGWLLLSFAAAAIGAVASVQAAAFYQQLAQPSWAPPSSVFGPVWSVLYALMGIAAWLVWRDGGWRRQRGVLTLFVIQLAANALWSWLFFGWHHGTLAFVDIVLLWLLIVATVIGFWRVRPLAGSLAAAVPVLGQLRFGAELRRVAFESGDAGVR